MRFKLKIILPVIAYMLMFVVHANAEVILAKDIFPGANSSDPSELTNVNGTLFFAADNGVNGVELWKASGTGGTTPLLVKDIYDTPSINSSDPHELTNVNGTLFFAADDGTHGVELWKSNGAASGTLLVMDINTFVQASDNSNPRYLTNVNGTLFFAADDGIPHGIELWRHDPKTGTTELVENINPTGNSNPRDLTNVNGTLFFAADSAGIGSFELWRHDPATGVTELVQVISNPTELTSVGNALFFAASNGVDGVELWRISHTGSLVPTLVKDINSGGDSSPDELTNVGGILFFVANDGAVGRELWKSDGTDLGTVLVKDIRSGNTSSNPSGLTNVNGTLFFAADDGTHGIELWKSDGTDAGTVPVKDINTGNGGADSSNPTELTAGSLFFAADDGANGRELWTSDGTEAGTVLVKDINAGGGDSDPHELTNVSGTLFFAADDGSRGNELWKSSTADGAVVTDGGGCFIETMAFDMPHEIYAWILKAFWDK